MAEKYCPMCRKDHPLTAFDKKGFSEDGLNRYCKTCQERVDQLTKEMVEEAQKDVDTSVMDAINAGVFGPL